MIYYFVLPMASIVIVFLFWAFVNVCSNSLLYESQWICSLQLEFFSIGAELMCGAIFQSI